MRNRGGVPEEVEPEVGNPEVTEAQESQHEDEGEETVQIGQALRGQEKGAEGGQGDYEW